MVNTAQRQHAGPTVFSDIENLERPEQAPTTLRFSTRMVALMAMQWRASFPHGKQKEQGGTIVADHHGSLSVQNLGGDHSLKISNSHLFLPDVKLKNPVDYKVVGTFHTHPYDQTGDWATGVSFSGGDMGTLILCPFTLAVVQSGPRIFAFVKTRLTPTYTDKWALHKDTEEEVWMRMKAGQTFSEGSRRMAAGRALRFGFAYYQGMHGILTRI